MHREALDDIAKAEIFRVLPPERRARLEPLVHGVHVHSKRALYFEGAAAERLWIVREGRVRLYKASPSAQITALDVLGPGEVFGALTALEKDTYPSSAEAVGDAHVWWLPRPVFLRLLQSEPQWLARSSRSFRAACGTRRRGCAPSRRIRRPRASRRRCCALRAKTRRASRAVRSRSPRARRWRPRSASCGASVGLAGLVRGEVGKIDILQRAALEDIARASP